MVVLVKFCYILRRNDACTGTINVETFPQKY
jgi:hypothetical protein